MYRKIKLHIFLNSKLTFFGGFVQKYLTELPKYSLNKIGMAIFVHAANHATPILYQRFIFKKGPKMLINVKWICQPVMINYILHFYWQCSTNCLNAFQSVNKNIIISLLSGKWTIVIHKKNQINIKKWMKKLKTPKFSPLQLFFFGGRKFSIQPTNVPVYHFFFNYLYKSWTAL